MDSNGAKCILDVLTLVLLLNLNEFTKNNVSLLAGLTLGPRYLARKHLQCKVCAAAKTQALTSRKAQKTQVELDETKTRNQGEALNPFVPALK